MDNATVCYQDGDKFYPPVKTIAASAVEGYKARGFVEVEIDDDGNPVAKTSGKPTGSAPNPAAGGPKDAGK